MSTEQRPTAIENLSIALEEAEHEVQSAKYKGDRQALGYAEARVLRLKHSIADLDPLGVGHIYAECGYGLNRRR